MATYTYHHNKTNLTFNLDFDIHRKEKKDYYVKNDKLKVKLKGKWETFEPMEFQNLITIEEYRYYEMMDEVSKMRPNKRRLYKSTLTDKFGVKTKVIFQDGKLKNYSLITRKFENIVPFTKELLMDNESIPVSNFGAALKDISQALGSVIPLDTLYEALGNAHVDASHTGNHTGRINHKIAVPCSAGQPVRA